MQSGRGEEAADGAYRPVPLPHEPQASAVPEAHEGVVLPAHGDQQWPQPDQTVRPASGEPWGAAQHAAQQPPQPQASQGFHAAHDLPQAPGGEATQLLPPYGQRSEASHFASPHGHDSEATQLLTPYSQESEATQLLTPYSQESEATQLLTPYGQAQAAPGAEPSALGGDSEKTQLIAPVPHQQPVELPQQAAELRQPLPPEQQFRTPVPPLPPQPPAEQAPPMPSAGPYSIRPGAPGDQPPQEHTQLLTPQQPGAAPTEQLPRYDQARLSPQSQDATARYAEQAPPRPRDDYDFLYRQDGDAGAPQPPHTPSYGSGMPPQPPYPQQPARNFGQDAPGRGGRFGKLSPLAMIGIGVAGIAVVGVAVGAALSGGGDNSADQQKAGVASPAAGGTSSGGAGDGAQAQAQQLDSLLKDSNSSRASVISAVASIKSCSNMGQSSTNLRTAASQRDQLITRLDQLALDKLPNHDELVKQLTAAWKASAEADNDYAQWGDQVSKDKKGCEKGQAKGTPAAQKGNAASGRATFAKKKAADLWNPIASQYGLTQRQFTDL